MKIRQNRYNDNVLSAAFHGLFALGEINDLVVRGSCMIKAVTFEGVSVSVVAGQLENTRGLEFTGVYISSVIPRGRNRIAMVVSRNTSW